MKILLPIMLIVLLGCFNSTAYADKKSSKEIYAEIMKKRLARKLKKFVVKRVNRL